MSLKVLEGDDKEKIVKAFLAEFFKAAILGDSRIKNAVLYSYIPFWHFYAVFHHKVVFLSFPFLFFFDEVSTFRSSLLTNQKHELVIKICQWSSINTAASEIPGDANL